MASTNETLQKKRDEANRIVEEMLQQAKIIEAKVEESAKLINEIVVDSNEADKLKARLNTIINTTNATITKFRSERDSISKLLNQVNTFYSKKFQPLSEKIEDKQLGLKAILLSSESISTEIVKLKNLSTIQFNEVKSYANDLKKKNKELLNIDNSIRKILASATVHGQSIDAFHKLVKRQELEINKASETINLLLVASQKSNKIISELLDQSNNDYKEIKDIKFESSELLKEIQSIYDIAAETGLSGEFDKRRSHLQESLNKWEKRIFYMSLLSLALISALFFWQLWLCHWDIKSQASTVNFYLRFLMLSPVIYYLYFCSSQYSETKKLHDKYSFKTTLAMSIKNHISLLINEERFSDKERMDKILEFILEGFQKIYSEPYSDEEYKLKLKLANMKLDIQKKLLKKVYNENFNINKSSE